jgi:hypothetical protein
VNKFGAVKTVVDGVTFASKKEARRYSELKLLERAGEISDLKLQPRYDLTVNGKKVCTYVGDFQYIRRNGVGPFLNIEDAKGFKTPTYKLKAKLFEAVMGFPIVEV